MVASILIVPSESSRVRARVVVVPDDMACSVTSTASPVLAMCESPRVLVAIG